MHPVFFEIFGKLPRVGPGNNELTKIAYKIIESYKGFSHDTNILDVGCGTGIHTVQLAQLTEGKIIALDNHQVFLDKLRINADLKEVSSKIEVHLGDMGAMDFKHESFDLIWAEGSIFILGFERGLQEWRKFLKPHGFMALTDLFWFKPNPPAELKNFFDQISPGMLNLEEALTVIDKTGYDCFGHFRIPENSWWDYFYNPLEDQVRIFRKTYSNDTEAMPIIEALQTEIDLFRKYSEYYGYFFFLMRKKQ